ncbi:ribosomal protein S18 acetylase RimI-like enzyme [Kineothrix alysoides]|uniref:Ribosomal protein S18 acetylase RimI-like enzyme n=2 Tax=Kineothrix alysoides TaxID=1469948 RepID=A0A4R1R253_9FIRM|nr:ribosomal protein S18 acetylase RimI-like enzyme [Kineothrix alysoides]
MEEYRVYHKEPSADLQRLYNFLMKMDSYMVPPLSERVCIKDYAKKLSEYADIFYVQTGEIDCGHCAIYMNQKEESYISSFGVLPEYQGLGAGSLLMQNVLQNATGQGIRKISLEVHKDNKKALRLYSSMGFKSMEIEGEFIKMVKELHAPIDSQIKLLSTSLMVTERCTLRCKLCLSYAPYYASPKVMKKEKAERVLREYFNIIGTVDKFAITGGEPLTNPDIIPILKIIFSYKKQIEKEVIFITNGTIKMKQELIELFENNKDKIKIIINNYGNDLSTKAQELYKDLCNSNLGDNTILYTEGNRYGWIDCRDHSLKHETQEERDKQGMKCEFQKNKKYIISAEGGLYSCTRSYYRMVTEIIPHNKQEYIDLLEDISSEDKKKALMHMLGQKSSTSCAYCEGLSENTPKYPAAEQFTV